MKLQPGQKCVIREKTMSDQIALDPGAEAVLRGLQPLFVPFGTVTTVALDHPGIVAEFRPSGAKVTDLGAVPKAAQGWAFGVELGGIHSDARLCALVFTHFSRLQSSYAANPALRGVTVSCWNGGAAIWLRVTGRIPRDFAADGVHWCSSGIIPVGCPTQPPQKFITQAGEIKVVDFSQLLWSEQQQAEIDQIFLEMEVGTPFRTVARGRRVINLSFWGRYFVDLIPVTYDPDRNLFAWGDPAVGTKVLNEDDTLREYTRLLEVAAPSFGGRFPQGEIRPARVRQLVARIKVLTQQTRASDNEILEAFVNKQFEKTPGKEVASHEAWTAFVQFCHGLGRPPCSTRWFYRNLRVKIHRRFGVDPRHDILRNGKEVRGYGLSLKAIVKPPAADVSDVPDVPDATDGA